MWDSVARFARGDDELRAPPPREFFDEWAVGERFKGVRSEPNSGDDSLDKWQSFGKCH